MEIVNIKLSDIVRNENQPRKNFDEQSIQELSESIAKDGLMQPITVRNVSRDTNNIYEIVQGERRYRAAGLAGLKELPCFIQELSDEDAFHLSVIENIQREQMTAIEEAQAFQKYIEMGYKHNEIADKVSKSRTYISSRLRLLQLSTRIQNWIADGKLSEGHAKQILRLKPIIERLWKDKKDYRKGGYFSIIQSWFDNDFWERLDDGNNVSVLEIKKWGDDIHYQIVNATILHYKGLGETFINNIGTLDVTAEEYCNMFNLHISKINEDDISFANSHDMESMKNEFDNNVRPWMVDKFWDGIKIELFHSGVDPSLKWLKPKKFTGLDKHNREIKRQMDIIHATLYLFAKMFYDYADEKGLERLSTNSLAERFVKDNENHPFNIKETEKMFDEALERNFSDTLLNRIEKEINESVT